MINASVFRRSEWKGEVGGRLRYIELSQRLMKAIRHLGSKRVLSTEDGSSLTQQMVRKRILAAEQRAGLAKQGVHILRHTFCSHLECWGFQQ